jgi:hypothetical protein
MKLSRAAIALVLAGLPVLAAADRAVQPKWSVEVDQVETGSLNIAPEFKVAIYENLVEELAKSKQFAGVLRSGERNTQSLPGLLILKTTVEAFSPGSETKRAVTTVAGATKLKVRTQLCAREGNVVLVRVVEGNVRFFGGNLRATHNLARHVADSLKKATLPAPPQ